MQVHSLFSIRNTSSITQLTTICETRVKLKNKNSNSPLNQKLAKNWKSLKTYTSWYDLRPNPSINFHLINFIFIDVTAYDVNHYRKPKIISSVISAYTYYNFNFSHHSLPTCVNLFINRCCSRFLEQYN